MQNILNFVCDSSRWLLYSGCVYGIVPEKRWKTSNNCPLLEFTGVQPTLLYCTVVVMIFFACEMLVFEILDTLAVAFTTSMAVGGCGLLLARLWLWMELGFFSMHGFLIKSLSWQLINSSFRLITYGFCTVLLNIFIQLQNMCISPLKDCAILFFLFVVYHVHIRSVF